MGKSREIARLPNAPVFSASRATSQSLTSGAFNKVQCATEDFDTANAYDNSTNFRFQPTVAGYYDLRGAVYASGTNMTHLTAMIYKNGSLHRYGQPFSYAGSANELGSVVGALVYMNGSTDYVELYAYVTGTTPALVANAALNYFQGAMVRPA